MSIFFQCPKCSEFCAFDDQYAGRRAKCLKCQSRFIIPEKQGEKPLLIEEKFEVVEGFYRRAVKDCWKIFVKAENLAAFAFVAVLVSLEYFVGFTDYSFSVGAFRVQLPTGWIALFISYGCLFWYYMQIISTVAFEGDDELPDVSMGGGFLFLWNMLKSIYLFAAAFLIVLIPFAVLVALVESCGLRVHIAVRVSMLVVASFAFPISLLTIAAGREIWMVFHVRYTVDPIGKAFKPYLVVAVFVAAGCIVQISLTYATIGGYGKMSESGSFAAVGWLVLCILSRMLNLVAMRAIGLFGFHYRCWLRQLHLE